MGFRQIFAARAVAFEQVGNRVQAQTVDAHVEPEIHHVENRAPDRRVGEIQVGLVRVKSMPIIGFGQWIPRPVGSFEVFENNPRFFVRLLVFAPDIKVPLLASRRRPARALKPRVLIRSMIDDQLRDHAQPAPVCFP